MNNYMKKWLRCAGVRAVKTMAQTAVATIAVLAGLLSLLTSVAGLPEVENGNG